MFKRVGCHRTLRLLQLLPSRGRPNAKGMAAELECAKRTVYRDLEFLSLAVGRRTKSVIIRLSVPNFWTPTLNENPLHLVEFRVADRLTVERGVFCKSPYIVISIRDPGTRRPRIPITVGLRDILYLAFHDAEPVVGWELPSTIKLINTNQARRIARFSQRYREQIKCVLCHCEQGMSRSPAIAAAIAHCWGVAATQIVNESQPNNYVYGLVVQAMTELAHSRSHFAK